MYYANSVFVFQKKWIIDAEVIAPANQMSWAMHLLGELRRNRRTKLKKTCYPKDASKEEVLAKIPDWADVQHYAQLVDYWFHPDTQVQLLACSIMRFIYNIHMMRYLNLPSTVYLINFFVLIRWRECVRRN